MNSAMKQISAVDGLGSLDLTIMFISCGHKAFGFSISGDGRGSGMVSTCLKYTEHHEPIPQFV